MTSAKDRITRSMLDLEVSDPFFASIFIGMERKEDNNIPTAATDGTNLIYNSDFVNACSRDKLNVVLAHEVLHCVFKHPVLFNALGNSPEVHEAGELSVNSLLHQRKGFPDDAILPGRGKYSNLPLGKSTEWYLEQLNKSNKEDVSDNNGYSSSDNMEAGGSNGKDKEDKRNKTENAENDKVQPRERQDKTEEASTSKSDESHKENQLGYVIPKEGTKEELDKLDNALDDSIISAATISKEAGKLSGDLEDMIDNLLGNKSEIDWRTILRRFLTRSIRTGRSFRRPNRRALYRGDIQPSRLSKGLGTLIVGVDTSGSMDLFELDNALRVCIDVGKVYPNFKLGIAQFDTEVKKMDWYDHFVSSVDCFKNWTWKGRGGTSYVKFFDYIEQHNANVVVIVTDGYPNSARDWDRIKDISVPVIWLITTRVGIPEFVNRRSKVIRIGF